MKSSIVESAELYVVSYLKHNLPSGAIYHSIAHTQDVVDAAKTLAKEEGISIDDKECVLLACWFHDIGYTTGIGNDHEERSIKEAVAFLEDHHYPSDKIKTVVECIEATKMPQAPKNKLQQIICDADLFHVATSSFESYSKLLRAEWELLEGKTLTDVEWYQCNSEFLKGHKFYTDFAFRHWSALKASNLVANEKKLKNAIQKEDDALLKRQKKKKPVKTPKVVTNKADKTVETMYRVTLRNHIKLSAIADSKANILLSVNAIILSLGLSNLFPKLDKEDNYYLIIPTIIFLLTAVISIVFAILSTRPKVTSGTFSQEDVDNKKVNLLFFGNFHKVSLEMFDKSMFTLIDDKEYLYKSLNKDLYFLGLVLARKYKLLRLTYVVFMTGIILSVISFGIAFYNLGVSN